MCVSMTIKSLYILAQPLPLSAELMTQLSLRGSAKDAKQRGNNYSLSILFGENKWPNSSSVEGVETEMKSYYYMMWGGSHYRAN